MSFMPSWPLGVSQLLMFSLLLLAGIAGGEIAQRLLKLPRITGYVVAGVLIGQFYGAVNERPIFADVRIFAEIALGLLLFVLGRRLDLTWLMRDRWLLATGVAESGATFLIVYGVLSLFGIPPAWAAVAAAVAMSTSPGVVLLVVRDNRAEGQLTERLLCLTALNGVFAVITVTMLLSWLHLEYNAGLRAILLHPLYLIAGSLLLAGAMSWLLMRAARYCGKRDAVQFVLIVGAVLATVAVAGMLKLSVLVALLVMGVLVRNFDTRRDVLSIEFGFAAEPFFVILFVIVGATFPLDAIAQTFFAALAFFLARLAAKILAVAAVGHLGGIPVERAALMGLALAPMSGLATLLVTDTAAIYPGFSDQLAAMVLGAIALANLFGPLATQYALRRAGETSSEG